MVASDMKQSAGLASLTPCSKSKEPTSEEMTGVSGPASEELLSRPLDVGNSVPPGTDTATADGGHSSRTRGSRIKLAQYLTNFFRGKLRKQSQLSKCTSTSPAPLENSSHRSGWFSQGVTCEDPMKFLHVFYDPTTEPSRNSACNLYDNKSLFWKELQKNLLLLGNEDRLRPTSGSGGGVLGSSSHGSRRSAKSSRSLRALQSPASPRLSSREKRTLNNNQSNKHLSSSNSGGGGVGNNQHSSSSSLTAHFGLHEVNYEIRLVDFYAAASWWTAPAKDASNKKTRASTGRLPSSIIFEAKLSWFNEYNDAGENLLHLALQKFQSLVQDPALHSSSFLVILTDTAAFEAKVESGIDVSDQHCFAKDFSGSSSADGSLKYLIRKFKSCIKTRDDEDARIFVHVIEDSASTGADTNGRGSPADVQRSLPLMNFLEHCTKFITMMYNLYESGFAQGWINEDEHDQDYDGVGRRRQSNGRR